VGVFLWGPSVCFIRTYKRVPRVEPRAFRYVAHLRTQKNRTRFEPTALIVVIVMLSRYRSFRYFFKDEINFYNKIDNSCIICATWLLICIPMDITFLYYYVLCRFLWIFDSVLYLVSFTYTYVERLMFTVASSLNWVTIYAHMKS
jgi:hypothetical protein